MLISGLIAAVAIECGYATYYHDWYDGKITASGVLHRQTGMTAAHKTRKLGSTVKVRRVGSDKYVTVKIIDRGPYGKVLYKGRFKPPMIDLTKEAMRQLGGLDEGVIEVCIAG